MIPEPVSMIAEPVSMIAEPVSMIAGAGEHDCRSW
jgi:hypothetical protein